MQGVKLILDGDGAWPDLKDKYVDHVTIGIEIAALASGMQSGHPSVMIRADLDETHSVLIEMSLAMFQTVAKGLTAKYGDFA